MTQYSNMWETEAAEETASLRRPNSYAKTVPRGMRQGGPPPARGRLTLPVTPHGGQLCGASPTALPCLRAADLHLHWRGRQPLYRGAVTGGTRGRFCMPSSRCWDDVQDSGGIASPGLQGHRDARRCGCRRLPWGTRLPPQRPPRAALCAAVDTGACLVGAGPGARWRSRDRAGQGQTWRSIMPCAHVGRSRWQRLAWRGAHQYLWDMFLLLCSLFPKASVAASRQLTVRCSWMARVQRRGDPVRMLCKNFLPSPTTH